MFAEITILPRFCDTDQSGHINNTATAQWLEFGRSEFIFKHVLIKPSMMLRHVAINYNAELNFPDPARVRVGIERLGNSSVNYYQEIWQNGKCCITARAVDCYFDPATRQSAAIPDSDRRAFEQFKVEVSPD